jgi:hypothetical protein
MREEGSGETKTSNEYLAQYACLDAASTGQSSNLSCSGGAGRAAKEHPKQGELTSNLSYRMQVSEVQEGC